MDNFAVSIKTKCLKSTEPNDNAGLVHRSFTRIYGWLKAQKPGRWSLHKLSVSIKDRSRDKILETDVRCNKTSL